MSNGAAFDLGLLVVQLFFLGLSIRKTVEMNDGPGRAFGVLLSVVWTAVIVFTASLLLGQLR